MGIIHWLLQLATVGVVSGLEIDTNHFKGNCPESCVVEGYLAPERAGGETHSHMGDQSLQQKFAQTEEVIKWEPILPRCALQPHKQHYFKAEDLAVSAYDGAMWTEILCTASEACVFACEDFHLP